MEVMVLIGDGIKGGWILWAPLQGPARREPGGPALPHDLQHGGRCGTTDLGIRGDSNGGGSVTRNISFLTGHPMYDIVLLY